jgi:squalene-hopene/tetraprenyl-beta-curcumene cyclase
MILIETFFGRRESQKVADLARTIRGEALPGGGWSQYRGGPADHSVSCLSYFALKVAGDEAHAPHMRQAREVILRGGGVERANTYTKYHLAFFGQYPWSGVPAIPPEMVFLPQRSPFTVYDMSSWSRTIFVPLSILYAKKPLCPLPPACSVREIFDDDGNHGSGGTGSQGGGNTGTGIAGWRLGATAAWQTFFFGVDRVLKIAERAPGVGALRRAAVDRAAAWMIERLEESDGLSAILPAMANSVLALKVLGYTEDHPLLRQQLQYLDDLLIRDQENPEGALVMQPCVSPVWDTVLASYALAQAGVGPEDAPLRKAASWLLAKQTRRRGDWAQKNDVAPGGWYFEHRNEFYPDVDDTCVALMVLKHAKAHEAPEAQEAAIARGLTWMLGMQNSDGGWASFDRDNAKEWLTHVPFADHNAMIDPSTADITARVLESLSYFPGYAPSHPVVARAIQFLKQDQLTDGSWYGRWGVNYIYGTWQVLRGLARIGEDMDAPYVRRAARWFTEHQNADGGWGESIASYDHPERRGIGESTPSQTAWALMGLIAAGQGGSAAVSRGVRFLLDRQDADGTWEQIPWTGTGFPKVFYLNYHYYRHYFPLMALAQYRTDRFGVAKPAPGA